MIGSSYHNEMVAKYFIDGKMISVHMCWSGDNPYSDPDRFYDLYDDGGLCLNEGEPWMDDGRGPPTFSEVKEMFGE